jgi:hypothetical protein
VWPRRKEALQPGDVIASLQIPGLVVDVDDRAQGDWLSTWGLDGVVRRTQPVGQVRLGEASPALYGRRSARWGDAS